jgi:intracellular multiplication protein IcmK
MYNVKWNAFSIQNRSIQNRFFAVLLLFLVFLSTQAQVVLAQEEISLEEYMKNNEPAQVDLQDPQEEVKSDNSILERLQEAISEDEVEADLQRDDVLPEINSKYELSIGGFENMAAEDIIIDSDMVAEQTQEELEEEIRREAYDAAITGLFPMKPDQIRALLRAYDSTQRAVQEPVFGVPTPQVSVATVSLDPGVKPMIITTATGHVTTLNILDITGAPWPVQDISWAGDFEVIEPEQGEHVIRITPLATAAYGNMSIRLLTLKTPVTIMLKTSKDEVQYRVDARIPEYGPFATAPLIQGGTERVAGNKLITSVLDGVVPDGARKLSVSGVDGRTSAYAFNGLTYLRTPLTLLSPGWEQSVSSADGMNVYALSQSPVMLLSDNGQFVRANVNDSKGLFDE